MAVAPAGILAIPLDHLADLLSNLSAFQTWTGEVDAAAAKAHTYTIYFDDPAQTTSQTDAEYRTAREGDRPLVVIAFEPGATAVPDTEPADYWQHSGTLSVIVEEIAGEDLSDQDAIMTAANSLGAILEELEQDAGTGGKLNVVRWHITEATARMAPEKVDAGQLDLVQTKVQIDWGED